MGDAEEVDDTAEETEAAEETPAKKERSSVTRTLVDPKANELQFIANRKKSGWSSYVNQRFMKDGKQTKSVRGATVEHKNLADAEAQIEKGIAAAKKLGWTERETKGGGYKARPDAFSLSNLPKPTK